MPRNDPILETFGKSLRRQKLNVRDGTEIVPYFSSEGITERSGFFRFSEIEHEPLTIEIEPGAAYSSILSDGDRTLKVMTNASSALVTVPSEIFPVGTTLAYMQGSTGPVTIAAGPGATINYPSGMLPTSAGEGHVVYAVLTALNEYQVFGGLLAPRLDALLQLAVVSRSLTAPPGSPIVGDRYIPRAPATGAWAGKEDQVAQWINGTWMFYVPEKGWISGIDDEDKIVKYNGADWVEIYEPEIGSWTPTLIGISGGTATLATSEGGYFKSGKWVYAYGHIVTSDTSTLNGQLAIGNIPFEGSTLPGVAGRTGGPVPFWVGLELPAGSFGVVTWMQDTTNFRLYRSVLTAGNQSITHAHISESEAITMYFNVHYRAE